MDHVATNRQKVNHAKQISVDDFKNINGVTQDIEIRLHKASIQTYAQLASLTPKEIISKSGYPKGYSIRQIVEEDWIGQAQKLSSESVKHSPRKKEAVSHAIHLHYENFTVEILLDEKNRARRSRIVHVQSGDADTWAGWEVERVFDFISRHTGVRPLSLRPTNPIEPNTRSKHSSINKKLSKENTKAAVLIPTEVSPTNPESIPSTTVPEAKPQVPAPAHNLSSDVVIQHLNSPRDATHIPEQLSLIDWKISNADADQSIRTLPRDQAFIAHCTLNINNESLPTAVQLTYVATISAKKLGGGKRQVIGEIKNTVPFEKTVPLTITCAALSQGVYRLETVITVRLTGKNGLLIPDLKAFLESGPLQVY